nr:putative selenium delivery protein YdfZ [Escherichia coli]
MTTYDRNRNAITTGSRVMVSGTGHTGKILSIDTEGLTAEQIRRGKTVVFPEQIIPAPHSYESQSVQP